MDKNEVSPWLIAFRAIFTIALIACILFIFHNSLENADVSNVHSGDVMQGLNALLAKFSLGPLSMHIVRKLAHFAEFTMLGVLLMLCLRVYTRHFVRHTSWPLLGGMTTALADETLQAFVPGRSSQVSDVWLDMAGVVAGLLAALLLLLVVRLITDLYAIKKENRILRAEHEAMLRAQREAEHARLARRARQRAKENSASHSFTNEDDLP